MQGLLLDLEQLAAGRILQDQRIPETKRLTVDLKPRSPAWFSIQKSSPIENIFSRIRYCV
jgi:hypothetical protein